MGAYEWIKGNLFFISYNPSDFIGFSTSVKRKTVNKKIFREWMRNFR